MQSFCTCATPHARWAVAVRAMLSLHGSALSLSGARPFFSLKTASGFVGLLRIRMRLCWAAFWRRLSAQYCMIRHPPQNGVTKFYGSSLCSVGMGRPPALLSLLLLVCASVTCAAGSASASKARSRAASGTACATQNGERTGGSQARHCMAGEKRNDDKYVPLSWFQCTARLAKCLFCRQELLLVTRLTGHISAIDAATGDVKVCTETGVHSVSYVTNVVCSGTSILVVTS